MDISHCQANQHAGRRIHLNRPLCIVHRTKERFVLQAVNACPARIIRSLQPKRFRKENLDRQIAAFKALGAQEREIITDKESGKDLNRAGYAALKNAMLRRGDTLVVKSLDRLSRNKCDIKNELQYFKDNGIRLKVIDLPTTMMELPEGQEWVFEMVNNILIEVLGTIAEQERETIRKRQAEGIEAAKQNGKKLGRPALVFPENWNSVYTSWKAGEITAKTAMEQTGTKRTSFYKLVNMTEKQ